MLKDKVATFEKVSRERFIEDVLPYIKSVYKYDDEKSRYLAEDFYEKIKIPARSTKESAGYDFFAYDNITLKKGIGLVIPTGIRCRIDGGYSLDLYPRSGQGFKKKIRIANTVGIIDSDYYRSSNEGHIMVKLVYEGFDDESDKYTTRIEDGKAFCQGIFHEVFGATNDDEDSMAIRDGGFGSTSKWYNYILYF